VNDKYRTGNIDGAIIPGGQANGIRGALVNHYPVQKTFPLHLLPEDAQHPFLEIHGNNLPVVTGSFRKLPGKEAGTAAKVQDMVAGLHKAFCQDIRPIEEIPKPGIELPGFFSREDLVVMVGSLFRLF